MELSGKTLIEIMGQLQKMEPQDAGAAKIYWKTNVEQLLKILQNTKADLKLNAESLDFKLQQANTHVNVRVELAKAFIELGHFNINGNNSPEFENAFKAVMKPMTEFIEQNKVTKPSQIIQRPLKPTLIKK